MNDPAQPIREFQPQHKYFIGIDSDGCAFDTMEVKHKECFIPNTINTFDLQAISKFAREAAEFVNLYSKWRGINRFPALLKTFELLRDWPDVQRRQTHIPDVPNLVHWAETETKLANPALTDAVEKTGHDDLRLALNWSTEVNKTVERFVRGVPPFPFVRESIEKMSESADIFVVSATPCDALDREWQEHDLAGYTTVIAGQEMGTKRETLQLATSDKYAPNHVLMIGDAPGDLNAARATNSLFYPINPGNEDLSWERFHNAALTKFFEGTYAGEYEEALIREFDSYLPELPPWKK